MCAFSVGVAATARIVLSSYKQVHVSYDVKKNIKTKRNENKTVNRIQQDVFVFYGCYYMNCNGSFM